MKIQKVLKFVGSTRGLRLSKKTLQLWSNVLESGLEDVHTAVSATTPGTKPAVAFLKVAFPKATSTAISGMIDLNNLHADLFPIAPVEGVTYIAEVIHTEGTQVELLVDSLRPEIKFNLELDKDLVGDCIEVVYRNGEFERKKRVIK